MKKRKILLVLLCIAMLLSSVSLIACDSESDKEKNPPASNNDDNNDDKNQDKDPTPEPENKLQGKTVIWNGDSICQGSSRYGNWATRIAKNNSLKDWAWKNYGIGGGTIVENPPPFQSGAERHSVSATLEQMYEEFPNADYVILMGGCNDADLLGRITNGAYAERFGYYDIDDFSGDYDRDTFCGALESIFYRAKEYWKGAKICYIVEQKMGRNAAQAATVENRYAYMYEAMQICEKWDIPYLNLWDDCDLDPNNPQMYDPSKSKEENEQSSMYTDGQHLSPAGYDYTTPIIEAWLKTL